MPVGNATKAKDVLSVVPAFQGEEMIIKRHQGTPDIVREVLDAHREFAPQYDDIVQNLSYYKTIPLEEQLFDFCKKNLHYNVEDEKEQTTRSPAGIIELGKDPNYGVDCKHYAGYIAGCLDAWNRKAGTKEYDWCYRFASYDSEPAPGHVFVVTKYDDGELWIDPVLGSLDKRIPSPTYILDKKPTGMLKRLSGVPNTVRRGIPGSSVAVGNCKCDEPKKVGATGSQVASTLNSLVPIVDNVPVVGMIAGYVLEAGSLVASIFGSKYSASSQVRWLTCFYEKHVLSLHTTSDNDVNAKNVVPSQLWFSTVLGVPVYDAITFHNLNGTDWKTGADLNNSFADRVTAYFGQFQTAMPTFITGITPAMVLQAVEICNNMNEASGLYGDWAYMTAAPQVSPQATIITNADGSLSISTPVSAVVSNAVANITTWVKANPVPAIAVGAALAFGIYELLKD